jgi:hypothetical protein
MVAARLVLDRVLPRALCQPTEAVNVPVVRTAEDVVVAIGAISAAALRGEIGTQGASDLVNIVSQYRLALESAAFEHRLQQIESRLAKQR